MTFELSNFDVMEYLWDTLEKTPDGQYIRYTALDIEQLWWMGFVDTVRVGIAEWKAAFEPQRQPDGTFLLGKDDFFALDRFRYKGEIRVPFDPMLINEGKYTDDGLEQLIDASVVPSCRLSRADLKKFLDELKKDFRQADGLILIKEPAKKRIKALIDANPSPLRNLELLMDQMIATRGDEAQSIIEQAGASAVAMEAARQVSRFSDKPTTRIEQKAMGLRAVEKARRKEAESEVEGVAKTELRKIRRSRKGMRG